jgi:integrase
MKGTIIEHLPKRGKKTFGYSLFLGRDETGKQLRQVKRGFRREKDAQDALRNAIEGHQRTPAAERAIPTFTEFFERWHAEYVKRECAPKTAERYYELGQYAVRLFGGVPLDKLDAMQLQTAVNQLSERGGRKTDEHPEGRPLAPKTVRHIAFLVQDCLKQAVDWDILAGNPMLKVRKPKVPRRRPKVADCDGLNRLLKSAAGTRVYPFIVLSAATGMRRGEVCAAEWSDLDWEKATLEVSKSLEQTKQGLRVKGTKSERSRRFSIPHEVLEVLRQHKIEQDKDRAMYGAGYRNLDLIFCRPDGDFYSPDRIGARVREAMQKAGLTGLSLHSLRHSHASELLSQGAPVTAVAERLGHASPNITLSIYSHALPADNEAVAKLWNNALGDVIRETRERDVRRRRLSQVITEEDQTKVIPIRSAS